MPMDHSARCSGIARSNGRIAHPNRQFHMINRPPGSRAPDPLGTGSGPSEGRGL